MIAHGTTKTISKFKGVKSWLQDTMHVTVKKTESTSEINKNTPQSLNCLINQRRLIKVKRS